MKTSLFVLALLILLAACAPGEDPELHDRYTAKLNALQDEYCRTVYDYDYDTGERIYEGSYCTYEYYQKAANVPPGECKDCRIFQRYLQCVVDYNDAHGIPEYGECMSIHLIGD